MVSLIICEIFLNKQLGYTINTSWAPLWFLRHDGAQLDFHNIFEIFLGLISAISVFTSGYYGKLSLEKNLRESEQMLSLLKRADLVYQSISENEKNDFFISLCNEELSELSDWVQASRDNEPEVSV